jgi:hypothetical protein
MGGGTAGLLGFSQKMTQSDAHFMVFAIVLVTKLHKVG